MRRARARHWATDQPNPHEKETDMPAHTCNEHCWLNGDPKPKRAGKKAEQKPKRAKS